MTYTIAPPAVTSLPIIGSDLRFPIRRVFCIGRNYADHAREMGTSVDKSAPMFFCKPADAVVSDGADVPYPSATGDLHHEVEMVVALGCGGRDLAPEQASALVWGYGVGLDLTRRDLQAQAKAKGHPWDVAKAFDHSAPISALRPAADVTLTADSMLRLSVNGESMQNGTTANMIFPVAHVIRYLSQFMVLNPGDLVNTGTPAGVALGMAEPRYLRAGDVVELEIDGLGTARQTFVQA